LFTYVMNDPEKRKRTVLPPVIIAQMDNDHITAIDQILGTSQVLSTSSVTTYHEAIKLRNRLRIDTAAKILLDNMASTPEVSVIVAGSDGKLEKGPFLDRDYSPLELIIICCEAQLGTHLRDQLLLLADQGILPATDNRIEVKVLAGSEKISGYEGNTHRAWPDRLINVRKVFGRNEVYDQAISQVQSEWKEEGDVRKSVRNYLSQFMKTCETGGSRGRKHFDTTTGEIFFDPQSYVLGLKYGPIRALQVFSTMHELNKGIQGKIESNTSDKIAILFPCNSEVIESYQMALRIYHWQQYRAKLGENAEIKLQPYELRKIVDPIYNFISKHHSPPHP